MSVLINVSRLSSQKWSAPQRTQALRLAERVVDLPVVTVTPQHGAADLERQVADLLAAVPEETTAAVVSVDLSILHALVEALRERGIRCYTIALLPAGKSQPADRFVRFRPMLGEPVLEGEEELPPEPEPPPGLPPEPAGEPEPRAVADSTPAPPPPAAGDKARREALEAVERHFRYGEVAAGREAIRAFLEAFPGEEEAAARAKAEGSEIRARLVRLQQVLFRHGPQSEEAQRMADHLVSDHPRAKGRVKKSFQYERARRARLQDQALGWRRDPAQPLTSVQPRGDHRVDSLPPSAEWGLWLDETGDRFGEDGSLPGRVMGLVLPRGAEPLPKLPDGFHAAQASAGAVDQAVQTLLDRPDTGMFGLAVEALPKLPGNLWSDTVLEVVAWAARLVPLPETGPARLEVMVEQRGKHTGEVSWELGARAVLRRLQEVAPERAARLALVIRVVPKGAHPALAYVDALAFTWGSRSPESRARFQATGLRGVCCLDLPPALLRLAWDSWGGARLPEGASWRSLVAAVGRGTEEDFAGRLLEHLSEVARGAPDAWARWLEASVAHAEGKAIDLRALGREVEWLEASAPPDAILPDRLRLLFGVAQLAEANHRGHLEEEEQTRSLEALSARLFEEDARLVCLADLHRAVTLTHHLDWDRASAVLARWKGCAPALPGLQFWGRLRSTEGQHLAFQGDLPGARAAFREALEAFGRLSDPDLGQAESRQTGTYLAISTMDDPTASPREAREAVERVIGPVGEAIRHLAADAHPRNKYAQHLLVRWLAARGGPDERAAWVETWRAWRCGEGHPWPLVAFYRAALLDRVCGEAAGDPVRHWARQAAALAEAPEEGWVLRWIGATIGVAATRWGLPWERAEERLAELQLQLPRAKVESLRRFLEAPGDPLALVEEVLPFNFR